MVGQFKHSLTEKKWQERWLKEKVYSPDLNGAKSPYYNLMMFPYPSAEGLHVGNMYAFTGADVFGRFQRMQGKDVFEPIGLDGFGIHSENYAIKIGKHPKENAKVSQEHYYKQLHMIGNGFDWDHTLETYDPDYYKWTQWLFIKMFKAGLAYKDEAEVNWCPSDKTVLSDEQVIDGKCERCGSEVTKRAMSSWFFKITDYADKLLANIDKIDWPEKIKLAQRNWIGRSKGLSIGFEVEESDLKIKVWTKFWETLYGTTFMVVAPEHPVLGKLAIPNDKKKEVDEYIKSSQKKSEEERLGEKTGVFTGVYAVNPANGKSVPIWVADYVLWGVGTGAVMGVPAHDERDFDFAKKYHLDIVQVVSYKDKKIDSKVKNGQMSYEGEGTLVNSGDFNSMDAWGEGKDSMAKWMIKKGFGAWQVVYHLRDWGISRQRYWGPPIPMVHCENDGWVPVDESDLPILLPDIKDFKPKGDGTSPLHNAPESWRKTKCPKCGEVAERELDVSDTFLDSSWYFLAYPNVKTKEWKGSPSASSGQAFFDKKIMKTWLPVDAYIGGAEHAVLHLMYSRFVTMVLKDLGYLNFEEPFPFLFGHGLIIKDGAKMSKSKGNVVNPDEYIGKFGADALRAYLMFLGPYDQGGDFRDSGMEGMNRFLDRVRRIFDEPKEFTAKDKARVYSKMHQTIRKVTDDISSFKFNTALAAIMEFTSLLRDKGADFEAKKTLCLLLAPYAPHISEELWVEVLHLPFSIHKALWPHYNAKFMQSGVRSVIVQINGKVRGVLNLAASAAEIEAKVAQAAREDPKTSKWLTSSKIKNTVFVPGKLINFVI